MKRERSSSPLIEPGIQIDGGNTTGDDAHDHARPVMASYCSRFPRAEKAVEDLLDDFLEKHKQHNASGHHDRNIDRIAGELEKFREQPPHKSSSRPVVLWGAMSAGKSNTLSSILDTPNISADSDGGSRGTYLVNEYTAAPDFQDSKFEVKAMYMTRMEILAVVKKHCDGIQAYLELCDESLDQETLDAEDMEDEEENYEAAIEYLHTLVCGTSGFESQTDLSEYFNDQYIHCKTPSPEAELQEPFCTKVVDAMMKSIDALVAPRRLKELIERRSGETSEELAEAFRLLSGYDGPPGTQTWPIVKKIQTQTNVPLLNEGITIADTPGLGDTNRTVVQSTESYVRDAGAFILTAPTERCGENKAVRDMVKRIICLNKENQTILALTKTDIVNPLTPQARAKLGPELATRVRTAESAIEKLKVEQSSLEVLCGSPSATVSELRVAMTRQKEVSVSIAQNKNIIDSVAVEDRNLATKVLMKGMFRKYSGLANAPDLPVVSVANHEYTKHLIRTADEDPPWLSKEQTGIPELQSLIRRYPAAEQFGAFQDMAAHDLPYWFQQIIKILKPRPSGAIAGTVELRKRIVQSCSKYRGDVMRVLRADVTRAYEEDFACCFRGLSQNGVWVTQAKSLLEQWLKLRSSTFKAFCRRDGIWKPQNEPEKTSWNESIGTSLQTQISPGFTTLAKHTVGVCHDIKSSATKLASHLGDLLGDDAYEAVPDKDDLVEAIDYANTSLQKLANKVFEQLNSDLKGIYINATIGDTTVESYISRIMHQSYKDAYAIGSEPVVKSKPAQSAPAVNSKLSGKKLGTTAAATKGRAKRATKVYGKATGAHQLRVNIIRNRLLGVAGDPSTNKPAVPSLVAAVAELAQEEFNERLETACSTFDAALEKIMASLLHDFDLRYAAKTTSAKAAEKAARRAEREANPLLLAAREAIVQLQGPINDHLEACKKYEDSAAQTHASK